MGLYLPEMLVVIDGHEVTVQPSQGDFARCEREGVGAEAMNSDRQVFGTLLLVWHALQRMKRKGQLSIDLPDTFEDFLDVGELAPDDQQPESDTEGKGSAQEAAPGI